MRMDYLDLWTEFTAPNHSPSPGVSVHRRSSYMVEGIAIALQMS